MKFHSFFYKACLDILKNLKDNETLRKKEMTIQLWLFYPRTVKSLIIISPKDLYVKRNDQINASSTKVKPPKVIEQYFNNYTFKIGVDNVFKSNKPQTENPEWQTVKLGDIWTIE
jgi:ribosomal 50S subunit-recycling heat shock protein